jgi:F-type H+-transporting ATPase subunit gamma
VATLRDIRNRITAVGKTQKITRAMKLVATARFGRAQQAIRAARPYAARLREVLASVAAGVDADAHPLLAPREQVRNLDVVVFTSDRGLCGAYNTNINKYAERLVRERGPELSRVRITPVGRKVGDYFRRRDIEQAEGWSMLGAVEASQASMIASALIDRYLSGEVDEVVLVYSEFVSALTQRPRHETLLPLAPPRSEEAATIYEIEPDAASLLGLLAPSAVEFSIFRALLENQAGEHGARMTAMDSATSNTEDLIRSLTIDFNKARQASITAELVEIVSGAEAL